MSESNSMSEHDGHVHKKHNLIDKAADKLKNFDLFKAKVSFKVSRKDKENQHLRQYDTKLGSIYGGLSTVLLWGAIIFLFGHGILKMFSGVNDATSSKIITNKFVEGDNELFVGDYAFLP
jgi:hypothetical protein